jgi:micrococcal nuclease
MYTYKAEVIRVVDGDTLVLSFDLGFNVKIQETVRLYGINTPEISKVKKTSDEYKRGMAAKDALTNLLANETITVTTYKDSKEKYGRYLASIYLEVAKIDVATYMVTNGFAEKKDY